MYNHSGNSQTYRRLVIIDFRHNHGNYENAGNK